MFLYERIIKTNLRIYFIIHKYYPLSDKCMEPILPSAPQCSNGTDNICSDGKCYVGECPKGTARIRTGSCTCSYLCSGTCPDTCTSALTVFIIKTENFQ